MSTNYQDYNIAQFPKAGVIWVMEEAAKSGFQYGDLNWSNLGQGAPNVKQIPNSPSRINEVKISDLAHGYAPVAGNLVLRKNIAKLYNQVFRSKWQNQLS